MLDVDRTLWMLAYNNLLASNTLSPSEMVSTNQMHENFMTKARADKTQQETKVKDYHTNMADSITAGFDDGRRPTGHDQYGNPTGWENIPFDELPASEQATINQRNRKPAPPKPTGQPSFSNFQTAEKMDRTASQSRHARLYRRSRKSGRVVTLDRM